MSETIAWHQGSSEAFIREAEKILGEAQTLPCRAKAYASLLNDFEAMVAENAALRRVVEAAAQFRDALEDSPVIEAVLCCRSLDAMLEAYDAARAALDEAGKGEKE